jgi:DNA-binding transcriptional MerR regulator
MSLDYSKIDYNNPDQLLTQKQASKMLHVSPRTLRKLEREGKLVRVQLGPKKPLYRLADLQELIRKYRRRLAA